jgi:hypothetical protein
MSKRLISRTLTIGLHSYSLATVGLFFTRKLVRRVHYPAARATTTKNKSRQPIDVL